MAETDVFRRKRAKHSSDVSEAGKMAVMSTDIRDGNIIVYGRRDRRKKVHDGLDEARNCHVPCINDAKRTLSNDKGQDERIKSLSTNKGHENIIVYERRNLKGMQFHDPSKAGRKATTIATHGRHKTPIDERHQKVVDYGSGMLRETKFNDLPEEILGLIVSRLSLRDAVRTSVLSTKLRRIWTCYPNLHFTKQALFPNKKFEGFEQMKLALIQSIQAIMKQHRGNGVERIVIDGSLNQCTSGVLSTCVRFAATSDAKSLTLKSWPVYPYCFPTHLFDTRKGSESVLEELCLKFVSLRIPHGFTGFMHLKRLELYCLYDIQDGELQQLLKNCLLLEDLILNTIYIYKELVISQALSRLRCLTVTICHEVKKIEIAAPNLEQFRYKGSSASIVVFPQTLKKLKYVSIQGALFNSHVGEFVLSVLPRSVPGLETLVWKTEGIEMDGLPNCIGRFQCLKTVEIELCASPNPLARDVLSYAALLDASPLLESFSLQLIGFINHPYCGIEFRKLPSSPHHHLKLVRIEGFTYSKEQIELVEYVLENATALENMIIETKRHPYYYKDVAIDLAYLTSDNRVKIL